MSRIRENASKYVVLGLVILFALATIATLSPHAYASTTLRVGSGIFQVRLAETELQREQGLSGVTKFRDNQVLLMIFPSSERWGIWMKDMKIPIDIVWLSQDKKVVFIKQNATPRDSTKIVFTPYSNARYVLEFPSGAVEGNAIKIGQTATFVSTTQGVH